MPVVVTRDSDVGAPVLSPTTGALIGVLDVALLASGWSKPFSSGHEAVYQQGGTGVNHFFRVVDPVSLGNPRRVTITGFDDMTAVATGTDPFPLAIDTWLFDKRHNDVDDFPYIVVADATTAYVFINADPSGTGRWQDLMMGDIATYDLTETHKAMVMFGGNERPLTRFSSSVAQPPDGDSGYSICRSYTGVAGALSSRAGDGLTALSYYGALELGGASAFTHSRGVITYPSNGGILTAEIHVGETTDPTVRGRLRGLRHWVHANSVPSLGDTFEEGLKTFEFITPLGSNAATAPGIVCIETSDTWDAD